MKRVILFGVILLFFSYLSSAQICASNLAVNSPRGVEVDSAGNKYISDTNNNRIVKIDTSGVPVVFAGDSAGLNGFVDGTGTNARFDSPHKIMLNLAGTFLYVADTNNNAIRKIDISSGAVTTVAGKGPGFAGPTDGPLSAAKFDHPKGLYVTTLNEVLVADTGNHVIRRLSESANNVMTIIGTGSATSVNCPALLNCPDANNPTSCLSMGLNAPEDIIVSTTGPLSSPPPTNYYEIFIANTGAHSIKRARYELGNGFTTFACLGNLLAGNGAPAYAVGSSTQQVQFDTPTAIETLNYGSNGLPSSFTWTGIPHLLIADSGNNLIRYLSEDSNGYRFTTPYAGAPTIGGNVDGTTTNPFNPVNPSSARFNTPYEIVIKANSPYPYASPNSFLVTDSSSSEVKTISGTNTNPVWNVASVSGGSCNLVSNTCSSPNDVILRLSSSTNAHGEEYSSTGSYTTDVCYSQIFGTTYSGTNPHSCSSGNANKVLRLSSTTNAHAEIPDASSPTYNTNICYGDLVCQSVAGNVACPVNTQEVVSLSSSTNAHLETSSANVYAGAGNYKVCCSNTPPVAPGTISSIQWLYYDGTPIPNTDPNTIVCPNRIIVSRATTSGASGLATFNLWDRDPFPNANDQLGGPWPIPITNNVADTPIDLTGPVIISAIQTALAETVLGVQVEGQELELFTEVIIPTDSEQSYEIDLVDNVALCPTLPGPTTYITAPVHQGVYFANTPINFVATCTSQAGPLIYNWQLAQNGNPITNSNPTFPQTFTQGGQVTVTLTCTDLQGLSATSQVQILVVASPFAFAYINDPAYNGVEYTTPAGAGVPYFPLEVSMGASQTFAVDANTCVVTCLGGNCPAQTQNSPSSCGGGPLTIVNAPSSPANAVWSGMNFDWNFWDSDWTNTGAGFEGQGAWGGFLEYDDMSENRNDKHMSVVVQATGGGTTASASFQRDFTLGRCMNNGNNLLNSVGQLVSTNNVNACNGGDGIPNSGDECCPSGQNCVDTTNDNTVNYFCEFLTNPITRCEDFTDADLCSSNTNPAYPLASNGGVLPATTCTFLECFWEDTLGCGVREVTYPNDPTTGQCNTQGCVLSDCTWSTEPTQCVNGRKTISYLGNVGGTTGLPICPGGSNSCTRPAVTVPCGSLNFELGFFGISQFIATAIIVILFYAIFGMRKVD